jgi:uncharacterized membrane protein
MNAKRWILGTLTLATVTACYVSSTGSSSQGSSGGSCGTVPSSCPSSNPSYASDVAPVMYQYCVSCHGPGGSVSNKPLDSYQAVKNLSAAVKNVTSSCAMPPASAAQPTAADRDTVLGWIVCGAQDN